MTSSLPFHLPSRFRLVALTVLATLVVAAGVLITLAYAWGESLREEGRLLPGTTIGSVDVGGATQPEAVARVEAALTAELDRPVTIEHDGQVWEVTARDLDATTDADDMVARAYEHTTAAGLTDLTRMRWTGSATEVRLDAGVVLDDAAIVAFVDELADGVDRDPGEASLSWNGEGFDVAQHRTGVAVDRHEISVELARSLRGDHDRVQLTVDELEPQLSTATARDHAADIEAAVEATLERTVTLTHGDASWEITPDQLDATAEVEPLIDAALAGDDLPAVPIDLPRERTDELVTAVAEEIDVGVRDARIELSDDGMRVAPERVGRAVDRDTATEAVRRALDGGTDEVELPVSTTRPSVTTDAFADRMLVLDQTRRQLHLYDAGSVTATWPVAVGTSGSPTPTGTFTVGAKRFQPTWHNPAPDGWGADMPATVGPGPSNPLGVRALNWNDRSGSDTLIRFHGTPDESSIGQAASRGCVRMFNSDVIDLYDRVSSGTTIVSIRR
jgi:lipoprotein-anchoring transpeptidase ErfK/SrfK